MMGQASHMPAPFSMSWCSRFVLLTVLLFSFFSKSALAQTGSKSTVSDPAVALKKAADLAKSGHCAEALPLLKRAYSQAAGKSSKRDTGLAGVRCGLFANQPDATVDFLRSLNRDFPHDPEILYVSVHAYSDLSTRAAQELARNAPNSSSARELSAESLELQGKWDEAAKQYQEILKQNPDLPGIHFRIGRLLLSKPNPPPDAAEQARKEFEAELKIDPANPEAEYVLGELARQAQQWDLAVEHFSRASKLDAGFGDAFLGLGQALIASRKFSEAISPLEMAAKLEPANPGAHYNLATAYSRTGRKADADREFAIHRQMTQKDNAASSPAGNSTENPN
jgi:tetratricopeptide (TPR) repeat protein